MAMFPSVTFEALQGYRLHDGTIVEDRREARSKCHIESRRRFLAEFISLATNHRINANDAIAIAESIASQFVLVPLKSSFNRIELQHAEVTGQESGIITGEQISNMVHEQ